jgi:hypothetical protein
VFTEDELAADKDYYTEAIKYRKYGFTSTVRHFIN